MQGYITIEDIERIYTVDYEKYICSKEDIHKLSENEKSFLSDIKKFNKRYIEKNKKLIELNLHLINEILKENVMTEVEIRPNNAYQLMNSADEVFVNKINLESMSKRDSFFTKRNGASIFVEPNFPDSKEKLLEVIVNNYNFPNIHLHSDTIGMIKGNMDFVYEYSKALIELELLGNNSMKIKKINDTSVEALLEKNKEILSLSFEEYVKVFKLVSKEDSIFWENDLKEIFKNHKIKIKEDSFNLNNISKLSVYHSERYYLKYVMYHWNEMEPRIKNELLSNIVFTEYIEHRFSQELDLFYYNSAKGDKTRVDNCIEAMVDSMKYQGIRYMGNVITGSELDEYGSETVKEYNKEYFWTSFENKILAKYPEKIKEFWEQRKSDGEREFWNSIFLAHLVKKLELKSDEKIIDIGNFEKKVIAKSNILENIDRKKALVSNELFAIYLYEFKEKVVEYDFEMILENADIKLLKLTKPINDEAVSKYNFSLDECIEHLKNIYMEIVNTNSLEILENNSIQKEKIITDVIDKKFRELCLQKELENIDKGQDVKLRVKRKV